MGKDAILFTRTSSDKAALHRKSAFVAFPTRNEAVSRRPYVIIDVHLWAKAQNLLLSNMAFQRSVATWPRRSACLRC